MPPTAKQTVLIVDDDAAIRTLVRIYLERDGYATITANSGDDALQLFEAHRSAISLLLTDVVMPGMDGIELGRKIRHMQPQLPVLVMSATSGRAHVKEFEFLSKPFIRVDLLNRVRQMLGCRKDVAKHVADPATPLKCA